MKFPIHTILYTKNWYKRRGGWDKYWMDLCHTINADGWSCYTRRDVAAWCLNRYDNLKETLWKNNSYYSTSHLFQIMEDHQRTWKWSYDTELCMDDLIISTVCSLFSNLSSDEVEGWERPNPDVLPLSLSESYVIEHGDNPGWRPGQMMCDKVKEINRIFPNVPLNPICKFSDYDSIEGSILIRNYEDVMPLLGSDCGSNIKTYTLTDKCLNNSGNVKFDDENYLDLGIYYKCKFEPGEYEVKIEKVTTDWETFESIEYVVRSIKKL